MLEPDGDFLRSFSVICPECQAGFSTICLIDLPPVSDQDIVEADLHRVMPQAEMRSALITVCPHCNYAGWTVAFKRSGINPELMPEAQDIEPGKKFALAVKSARDKGVDPLDVAFIAVNGLYYVREANQSDELWLELCAFEQHRGITQESLIPPSGQDHLLMAELWRQLKQFDKALIEYDKAAKDDFIPRELIRHQKMLATAGDYSVTILPPYIVRMVFPSAEAEVVEAPKPKYAKKPKPTLATIKKVLDQYEQALATAPPSKRVSMPAAPGTPAENFTPAEQQSSNFASTANDTIADDVRDLFEDDQGTEEIETTPLAQPSATAQPAIQPVYMPGIVGVPQTLAISLVQASHTEAMTSVQATIPAAKQHDLAHATPHHHVFGGAAPPDQTGKPAAREEQTEDGWTYEYGNTDEFPVIQLTDQDWGDNRGVVSRVENSPSRMDYVRYEIATKHVPAQQAQPYDPRTAGYEQPAAHQAQTHHAAAQHQQAQYQQAQYQQAQYQQAQHQQAQYQQAQYQQAQYQQAQQQQAQYQQAQQQQAQQQQPAPQQSTPAQPQWATQAQNQHYIDDRQPMQAPVQHNGSNGAEYGMYDYYEEPAPAQQQQQPQQQAQGSNGQKSSDYTDAVAQVESFLSLTRQPSYQNWIRSFRTD